MKGSSQPRPESGFELYAWVFMRLSGILLLVLALVHLFYMHVLNSVDALHGDLGIVNDGDVILALSYSGESEELLNLLPALKRFLVKVIAVTTLRPLGKR